MPSVFLLVSLHPRQCAAARVVRHAARLSEVEQVCAVALPSTGGLAGEVQALGDALRAVRGPGVARVPVRLSLAAPLALTKPLRIPAVAPEYRDAVIAFEAGEQLPLAVDALLWSHLPGRSDGAPTEVLFAGARRDRIEAYAEVVRQTGGSLELVLPEAVALWAAVHRARPEMNAPIVLIAEEAGRVSLRYGEREVFHEQTFARSVNATVPGASLAGPSGHARPLEDAELEANLLRFVLGCRRIRPIAPPATLVLLRDGADGSEQISRWQARLQIPVASWTPRSAFASSSALDRMAETGGMTALGAWTGLLAEEAGEARLTLLPAELQRRRAVQRRLRRGALAAAAVLVAGLPLAVVAERGRRQAEQAAQVVRAELDRLHVLQREIAQVNAVIHRTRLELAPLDRLQTCRGQWVDLLASVQDALADVQDGWLDALRVEEVSTSPPVDGRSAPTVRLILDGRLLSDDAASTLGEQGLQRARGLVAGLVGLPAVVAVEQERFTVAEPGVLRFELTLQLDPAELT